MTKRNVRSRKSRESGPPHLKSFNGKQYTLWSFGKSKKAAQDSARPLRGRFNNWVRVVKYRYPNGTVVWAVYARRRGMGGF